MSLIGLLTDFGTQDSYAGIVKAIIYGLHEDATVVDISHQIAPQNVAEGAYVLWSAYRYFPAGTIFTCIVDPGVGSSRSILAVETERYIFLAPDNGLLDLVVNESKLVRVVTVTNQHFFLSPISNTFHGRDVFAPVAAHLSRGSLVKNLGKPTFYHSFQHRFITIAQTGLYKGTVLHTDRFGNLITNIRFDSEVYPNPPVNTTIHFGKQLLRVSPSYAAVQPGGTLATINSSRLLEISVNCGNAKQLLNAQTGDEVVVEVKHDIIT